MHAPNAYSFGSFRFGPDEDTPWTGVATLRQVVLGADRADFVLYDRDGAPLGRGQVLVSASGGGGEVVMSFDHAGTGTNRASEFAAKTDRPVSLDFMVFAR